jgi:hypothetical protein
VSRSAYYEYKFHVPSDREIRRLLVTPLVADVHERSRGTYGMLRIRAALKIEHDMNVNKKLILSIMRELGIHGLSGPKKHKKNLVHTATEEDLVHTAARCSICSVARSSAGPSTGAAKVRSSMTHRWHSA